jgi:hypothetical protein
MTDMSTCKISVFGTGFMLAMLLAAFATFAQDPLDEDLMPAVDTSARDSGFDVNPDGTRGEAIDALGPGVESSEPAQDVTRSTSGNRVMDSMELGRTEITGNQELPKVLYIVPWQKSDPGDLMGRPVNSLLDEVLTPIDREEFIRQVDYFGDLHGDNEQE